MKTITLVLFTMLTSTGSTHADQRRHDQTIQSPGQASGSPQSPSTAVTDTFYDPLRELRGLNCDLSEKALQSLTALPGSAGEERLPAMTEQDHQQALQNAERFRTILIQETRLLLERLKTDPHFKLSGRAPTSRVELDLMTLVTSLNGTPEFGKVVSCATKHFGASPQMQSTLIEAYLSKGRTEHAQPILDSAFKSNPTDGLFVLYQEWAKELKDAKNGSERQQIDSSYRIRLEAWETIESQKRPIKS